MPIELTEIYRRGVADLEIRFSVPVTFYEWGCPDDIEAGRRLRAALSGEDDDAIDNASVAFICAAVLSWGLTSGGVTVPLTPESVGALPRDVKRVIARTILEAQEGTHA